MDEEQEIAQVTVIMKAAAGVISQAAFDLIYGDSHHWSSRPCGTCQAITDMTGIRFGCIRYAAEELARRKRKDGEGG